MKKIWKYELQLIDRQLVPIGDSAAKPLSVAEQNGKLTMWVELDTSCVDVGIFAICVDIFGTGNPLRDTGAYLGTVPMSNGLIWHVYTEMLQRGDAK